MADVTPRLRRAMTALLEHEPCGDGASARDMAAASGRALDRLSQRLTEIIGEAGVTALLLRAVARCRADFPFLNERVIRSGDERSHGEALCARLQWHEPAVIKEVSIALLATFASLLATIVGERLAWSLLRDVLPDTFTSESERPEAEE
ncbi:MAG TPA: hypothetical protein VNN07_09930 [Candidatus Tectomicrobia bacterium]|nr:hypothetical protein [Candidatus Tectomicrobia bacterium]